jgi:hypothetical protein
MSDLETKIRDLARAGEISHISLTPSQDGKTFRAVYAMCSKFGNTFAEDPDPVKAIMLALATAKTKKPPPAPAPTIDLRATREEDHTGVKLDGAPVDALSEAPHPSEAVDDLADLM